MRWGWGHPALVVSPFSPREPAGEKVLLAATTVSSCKSSTILDKPLGRSGKKILREHKIEPNSMRGVPDDLPPVPMHIGMAWRIVAFFRGVVMS